MIEVRVAPSRWLVLQTYAAFLHDSIRPWAGVAPMEGVPGFCLVSGRRGLAVYLYPRKAGR